MDYESTAQENLQIDLFEVKKEWEYYQYLIKKDEQKEQSVIIIEF